MAPNGKLLHPEASKPWNKVPELLTEYKLIKPNNLSLLLRIIPTEHH